jgi:hypothetical protein
MRPREPDPIGAAGSPDPEHHPAGHAPSLRDAAHRYADAGWPVFPCQPGGKVPATRHGHLDATTSHAKIDRWWARTPDANVGIATGAPGPDVLDIDVKTGRDGFAALRRARDASLIPGPEPRPVICGTRLREVAGGRRP